MAELSMPPDRNAERHVGHHAQTHRLVERRQKTLDRVGGGFNRLRHTLAIGRLVTGRGEMPSHRVIAGSSLTMSRNSVFGPGT